MRYRPTCIATLCTLAKTGADLQPPNCTRPTTKEANQSAEPSRQTLDLHVPTPCLPPSIHRAPLPPPSPVCDLFPFVVRAPPVPGGCTAVHRPLPGVPPSFNNFARPRTPATPIHQSVPPSSIHPPPPNPTVFLSTFSVRLLDDPPLLRYTVLSGALFLARPRRLVSKPAHSVQYHVHAFFRSDTTLSSPARHLDGPSSPAVSSSRRPLSPPPPPPPRTPPSHSSTKLLSESATMVNY